jgi:hypothetical protein
MDDLAQARLIEQATAVGLDTAEKTLSRARRQLKRAEAQQTPETFGEIARLQGEIVDAELDLGRWQRGFAECQAQRDRLETELQMYAEGLSRG